MEDTQDHGLGRSVLSRFLPSVKLKAKQRKKERGRDEEKIPF